MDPHLGLGPSAGVTPRRGQGQAPDARTFLESWFSRREPAEHAAIRQRLHQPYAERRIARFAGPLAKIADGLAAGLPAEGDLVADFFGPFAIRGTARQLGIPAGQVAAVGRVVAGLTAFMHRPAFTPLATKAVEQCARYLRGLVDVLFAAEQPAPTVAALRQIADAPGADVWDAAATLAQLLTAGYQPTTTAAALTWLAVDGKPAGSAPDLATIAAQTLRDNPPFPRLYRTARADCECLGVSIRAGSVVVVDVRAANRDPAGLARSLSFGHGPHHCVGASLARLQIDVAVRALLAHRPAIRTDAQRAETIDTGHLVQLRSLPFHRLAVTGGVHG